jgi:hypothetical protein
MERIKILIAMHVLVITVLEYRCSVSVCFRNVTETKLFKELKKRVYTASSIINKKIALFEITVHIPAFLKGS